MVLGMQGAATTELGEQRLQRSLLMEEPDDNYELKLPKMRSLVIMICTNVLLQVGLLSVARNHYCSLTSRSTRTDDVLYHRLFWQQICRVPRWQRDVFRTCDRYSDRHFWYNTGTARQVGRR